MSTAAPAPLYLRLGPDEPGEPVELVRGAAVGLTGPGALTVWRRFAAEPGVALLLPDDEGPLHPGLAIGAQVADAVSGTRRAALDAAIDLLELAGVPEPHERTRALPAGLSRLDRQRAQLALAIARGPAGLAAHAPTRGLSPADAATWSTALARVRARLGLTLVVAAEPVMVRRIADDVLHLDASARVRMPSAPPAEGDHSST